MKTIKLDGKEIIDKEQVHTYLKEKLSLPEYYGENLDALWDLLSIADSMEIILENTGELYRALGDYGRDLVDVFEEAAMENAKITFKKIFC